MHARTPESVNLHYASSANDNVYIYLVDVETGWVSGTALTFEDASLLRYTSRSPEAVSELIARCGAVGPDAALLKLAVGMSLVNFQASPLHQVAGEANKAIGRHELAGHWILFAYRMTKTRAMIARPIWASLKHFAGSGLLANDELMETIRQFVKKDTTTTRTKVGATLAAGGGAIVASSLRAG